MAPAEPAIRQIVAQQLQIDAHEIDAARPLVDYGLDSLRAMLIIAQVEDAFAIEASDIEIAMLHTINDLSAYVRRKRLAQAGAP